MELSFGNYIRSLRNQKNLTQRDLAKKIDINFTYLSKIENDKLKEVQFPSEDTIIKLAEALEVDEDELLLRAHKVPENMRKRVIERPEIFRKLTTLNDEKLKKLDDLLKTLENEDE